MYDTEAIFQGTQAILRDKRNLHSALPTEDFFDLLTPDEDGLSFLPILTFDTFTRPEKYHIEKDKELGVEFWFKKSFWGKE